MHSRPSQGGLSARPRGSKRGVLLRLGVYAFLCWTTMALATPLLLWTGRLIAAVMSTFAAAAIANTLTMRIYERMTLAETGLGWNAASRRHLALGLGGGLGAALLVLGLPWVFGLAVMEPDPDSAASWGAFLFLSILLLFGAIAEELMFRGYGFQILIPVFGVWPTLLPMAVLFAAAHSANLNVTRLGLLNTFAWGVLLGWAVLRSGDLWLAVGLHLGWNWALPLFGASVSGFTMGVTGYRLTWRIPEIWSGGAYGPEGGLLCTLVLAAVAAFLAKAPIDRQRLPLLEPVGESPCKDKPES
jgi:membrane protease YdiL (CAAX protease family)